MKSILRVVLLPIVVITLVLSIGFAPHQQASAQSDQCYGLNADDCALSQSAMGPGAMQKVSSFNLAFELTFNGTGSKGNTSDISVKGNGPVAFDPSAAGGLRSGDMAAFSKFMFEDTIAWSATTNNQTKTGNFEVRIVNGMIYFQGDNVTNGKWESIDPQQFARAGRSGAGPKAFGQNVNPVQALAMLGAISKLANTPGFIRAERTADTTVEGQQIATFVYHFDIQKLLTSPDFATFIKTMGAQNPRLQNVTVEQLQAFLKMAANALQNTTFSITRMVGVTDKLPHGFGIDGVLNVDPKAAAAMMAMMQSSGAATQDANAQPVKANLHFLLTISGIGNKVTVTAPEGATPLNFGGSESATPEATAAS